MKKEINLDKVIEKLNGKPREELIVPEIFEVKKISINTYHRAYTPMSEIIIDGHSPSYKTGDSVKVILDVDKYSCPIRKIIYKGFANLEKGDKIKAYILKYDIKKRGRASGPIIEGHYSIDIFYFDRDFKEEETVEKIEKLDKTNLERILVTFETN